MPQKTVAKAAAPAKKAPAKKAPARAKKESVSQGQSYACEVCGLVVSVDETCGCVEACDIVCCGEPMKKKAARTRAKAKAK